MASLVFKEIFQGTQASEADFMPNIVFAIGDLRASLLNAFDRGTGTFNRDHLIFCAMRDEEGLPH